VALDKHLKKNMARVIQKVADPCFKVFDTNVLLYNVYVLVHYSYNIRKIIDDN
jgi:succinate dehydrogenase hydrophobic anchor subunit